MDLAATEDMQNKLQVARLNFANGLQKKWQEIEANWQSLAQAGWEASTFETLHRQVHTLAGSSGTFGFSEVGEIARETETVLESLQTNRQRPNSQQEKEIQQDLVRLRAAVLAASATVPEPAVAPDSGLPL